MAKVSHSFGLMCVIATAVCLAEGPVQRISEVKKLYVASLGTVDGSDLIREKLIVQLIKSGKVSIVDSPEDADATLLGLAETSKGVRYQANEGTYGGSASGGTMYHANLVVRLVGKSKQVLWTDEATPSYFGSRSVSSNVAKQVASHLLKALEQGNSKQAKVGVATSAASHPPKSIASQDALDEDFTLKLQRLADLHSKGLLTDEEFKAAKAKLLQ